MGFQISVNLTGFLCLKFDKLHLSLHFEHHGGFFHDFRISFINVIIYVEKTNIKFKLLITFGNILIYNYLAIATIAITRFSTATLSTVATHNFIYNLRKLTNNNFFVIIF